MIVYAVMRKLKFHNIILDLPLFFVFKTCEVIWFMIYELLLITPLFLFNFPFDGTFLEFCIIVLVFGEVLSL